MHYEKLKKHKATVIIAPRPSHDRGKKEETSVIVKFHKKKRSPHRIGR